MWRSFAEHWHVEHCWSSEQSQYSRLLNLTQMNNSSGSLQDSPIKDLLKLFRSHVYLASCVCPFGLSVLGLSCSQSHVYRPSSEWEASIFTAFREAVISILTQRLGFCVSVFTAVYIFKTLSGPPLALCSCNYLLSSSFHLPNSLSICYLFLHLILVSLVTVSLIKNHDLELGCLYYTHRHTSHILFFSSLYQ